LRIKEQDNKPNPSWTWEGSYELHWNWKHPYLSRFSFRHNSPPSGQCNYIYSLFQKR
jgi:hypothetical protein